MAAISKAWQAIIDAQLDPDSPITQALMTAIRDDLIHVREWLGASYFAGAVQDHSHDGVDSALVEIGPNMIRNGSFESDSASWTFTDFAGGSHAIATTNHRHGTKTLTITSTVLANGGGQAISTAFVPVAEGESYGLKAWYHASVANVSCSVDIVWYDSAKASISTSNLVAPVSSPTAATLARNVFTAPANARFARVRLSGGVPAIGSAVGTVRFDGVVLGDIAAIDGTHIMAASIARAHLKTTTASGSSANIGAGAAGSYTLTGGEYSWWQAGASTTAGAVGFGNGNPAAGVLGLWNTGTALTALNVDERYVQASPPYDMGNGEVPLFVWALFAGATLEAVHVAPDPTWAYHGPTDIVPDLYLRGVGYKRIKTVDGVPIRAALKDRAVALRYFSGAVEAVESLVPVTAAMKNADMAVAPHPWYLDNLTGKRVALLDPTSAAVQRLRLIHENVNAREIADLLRADYLRFDNTQLSRAGPAGVDVVAGRWRGA